MPSVPAEVEVVVVEACCHSTVGDIITSYMYNIMLVVCQHTFLVALPLLFLLDFLGACIQKDDEINYDE